MTVWRTIKYQLYLLQLENYELLRYFKLLFKKGLWPRGEQRKELVWTMKARTVFTSALIFHLTIPLACFWFLSHGFSVLSIKYYVLCSLIFLILYTLYFLLYTFVIILLWPLDYLAKQIIIIRAKSKIKNQGSRIKIIGIAGSYGKTTMKEVLTQVLSSRYQVLSTPESVNTPVGIARWILKNLPSVNNSSPSPQPSPARGEGGNVEVAIVEMGEHYRGDVEEICNLAKPDIAVITGINEAHLERMKNMETVTNTVFEIVSHSKPGAMVVLNADDNLVMENYNKFVWPDHKISRFKIEDFRLKNFNTQNLLWEAQADGIGRIDINILGEYSLGDVSAAIQIGRSLGMSGSDIAAGIKNIRPVEHRLQPIRSPENILIIDDAYNGNPAGVSEAIKVLARFSTRRKIFVTPGLVEMGKSAPEVHRQIGRQLAGVADVVVLIRDSVAGYIDEGIKSVIASEAKQSNSEKDRRGPSGLAMTEVIWFNTAPEAHANLGKILKPNDVVLFQNDWGDQYI